MKLIINLDGNKIKLSLKNKNKLVSTQEWFGEYSLSEKLLLEIDAFLKKAGVQKETVEKVVPKISATSGVTSSRIVQTVAKAWNAANGLK